MKLLVTKIKNVILGAQSGTGAAILAVLVLCFSVQGVSVEIEGAEFDENRTYTQALLDFAKKAKDDFDNDFPALVMQISTIINDELALKEHLGQQLVNLTVKPSTDQLMDVLVKSEGRYAIVTGEVGSGRMDVVEGLARRIENEDLPHGIHEKELEGSVLFKVSARNFDQHQAVADLKAYLNTVAYMSAELGFKPIVVITEPNFMYDINLSILTELAPSLQNGLPVILVSDNKSYTTKLSDYPEFQRYSTAIKTKEISSDELLELLEKSGYLEQIKSRYQVEFKESAIEALVEVAEDYRIDLAEPSRSMQLIESIAVKSSRTNDSNDKLTKKDIFSFVADSTGVPVVPQDRQAFADYMKGVEKRVLEQVKHQDHLVTGLIKQFRRALTSRSRKKHSSAMIMGGTGVGKTYAAEILAKEFYGSPKRVLELDMAGLQDASKESVLFGAANGLISSDTMKGSICEFLDGDGKGGGIIIMNEFEEAHPKIITRMMEMFDNGFVMCGDGKVRYLGRSLIVMTSNKASGRLLPSARVRGASEAELQRLIAGISKEQMQEAWTEKESYLEDENGTVKNAVVQRIDEWYMAAPILEEGAKDITDLEVSKFAKEQAIADDISLSVDPSFTDTLTTAFYNEENGARQLRNMVQKLIGDAIYEYREKYGYAAQDFEISAKLHPSKRTESTITITEVGTENSLIIQGPKVPVSNRMLDPDFRNKLRDLEKNLKSEVFGQDEAIDALVGVINARFLKASKQKAMAGYLIGTTGTGKTQLGKSTAKFLFSRDDAYVSLSMGNITDKYSIGNILSPPKGIAGSGDPGELEEFLRKFPDGGVILFDEMSNAGGEDMAVRRMVYKQLYDLLDEGVYRNPSGKVYDLSKYVILFTGNDGEEIFKGANSDTIIEENYQELIKDQARMDAILLESGATKAFLQRLGFVMAMRPAQSGVQKHISKKMLEEWIQDVVSDQPFDIEIEDGFVEELAYLQFSPDGGARSVLKFLDNFLGRIIGQVIHDFDWNKMLEAGKRGKIKVGMNVDRFENHFYDEDSPYKNKASLTIESSYEGKVLKTKELNFTSAANFGAQAHTEDARDTAFHEMGHLVASYERITGKHPVKVNIVPEKVGELSTLGYAFYREVEVPGARDRNYVVHNIAGLLAGSMAESFFTGKVSNTGRSNDLQKAGKMIRRALLYGHLDPSLDTANAYIDEDGSVSGLHISEQKKFQELADEIMKDANILALKTIKEKSHIIQAGVKLLMEHGEINEKTIENLLVAGEKTKESAGFFKKKAVEMGIRSDKVFTVDLEGVLSTVDPNEETCEELFN